MALFVAIFEDRLDRQDVRAATEDAHVAYLDRHRDAVLVAGALRPEPDAVPTGGLWIIEAPSRGEAVRICEEDPFFTGGLRRSYRLESWSKGFPKAPVTL
jgi:uncharacterized protein YciI